MKKYFKMPPLPSITHQCIDCGRYVQLLYTASPGRACKRLIEETRSEDIVQEGSVFVLKCSIAINHTVRDCHGWSSIIAIQKEIFVFAFSFNFNLSSKGIKVENMHKSNCMQKIG